MTIEGNDVGSNPTRGANFFLRCNMQTQFKPGDRVRTNKLWEIEAEEETDSGVVTGDPAPMTWENHIWVKWDSNGDKLHINTRYLEHIPQKVEIGDATGTLDLDGTIMFIRGKIYKLVEVK